MNEPQQIRAKLSELVSDFDWLEEHCRKQPELAQHAGHLRLAAALARNVVGGSLEKQPAVPLHIAVVGGAGAGKSTVANFLAGAVVADANPQAGFTRHPTAYIPAGLTAEWPSYLGFLGPLKKLTEKRPANLDEDVYQVHRVTAGPSAEGDAENPLRDFIVWDCPDMTTWASVGYVSRLMEVSALADVIVYVASDERYNDAIPTEFLQLLVRAGKAVVVAITKMKEENATALAEHFRTEVFAKIAGTGDIPAVPIVAIPHLTEKERADPMKAGAKYRAQLINQILVLCSSPTEARERTQRNALKYLETASEGLLDVARHDLTELDAWKNTVMNGKRTFELQYHNEYLIGEPFRRFDRTRQQLMDMLNPTGPAEYVAKFFAILRLPFTYVWEFLVKFSGSKDMPNLPEQTVLKNAMASWLESIQAESLRRGGSHPLWSGMTRAFEGGLKQQALDKFQTAARQLELKEGDDLEQAGRSLTDSLSNQPAILWGLRIGKIAIDVVAALAVIWYTWVPSWYHLLLLPVAVAISHTIAELAIRLRVEAARRSARVKRESLLQETVTESLSHWLVDLPATGGTAVERLQLVLRRVPETLKTLAERSTS